MKFGAIPIDEAEGTILAHKIFNANGRMLLNKGRILSAADIQTLREHQHEMVIVARLDENDVHEDEAARRVGAALAGSGITLKTPGVGRANLIASERGVLRVNVPVLERLNNIYDGITIATLHSHTLVDVGELVTLVKIIPFGVPDARVKDVECIAAEANSIVSIRPLKPARVALIISGHDSVRERMIHGFYEPVKQRIEFLGSELLEPTYVAHDAQAIAEGIRAHAFCDLILIASMSAIIDREDLVPTALLLAGGSITQHGVPVDPGTLLMMGYLGNVPVVGAPGCIKSPKTNVIDWILPRLLAGERLTRADLVAMGHGGLLQDVPERGVPRSMTSDGDEA
jgi:molybdenum cofactor cytidylyltransferase